jgi:hypothetical protein
VPCGLTCAGGASNKRFADCARYTSNEGFRGSVLSAEGGGRRGAEYGQAMSRMWY